MCKAVYFPIFAAAIAAAAPAPDTGAVAAQSAAAAPAAAATNEVYVDMISGKPWTPDSPWTIEQLKARDERVLRKTGGFLFQAAVGPRAMLLDGRAKPLATIDEVARLYKLGTRLDADVVKEGLPEGASAEALLDAIRGRYVERKGALMVIAVVDGGRLPVLSVFPEERIGIVNASRLRDGDDPSAPEMRVAKEMWRAIGFIGGVGFSQADNDVMRPYFTVEDLDGNTHPYIQPMNMAKMRLFLDRFGVKPERKVPYRVAVKEGWAAAPTNDYQKAIWEELHSQTNAPAAK